MMCSKNSCHLAVIVVILMCSRHCVYTLLQREVSFWTDLCMCVFVDGLQIKWGACGLVLAGNTVVFVTILLFFYFFGNDDSFEYSTW